MPAGRPCTICKSPEFMRLVIKMIAAGASDQDVANKLGLAGTRGRMCVARHRQKHIEAPARALAIAADKGHSVVKQRKETIKAAEAGDDVKAFLGLEEITRDARGIAKDLKKARKATKGAGQYSVMTGVVAQEHKSLELRGKLGNHPGFVPQKLNPAEAAVPFNLTINMPNGVTQRISGAPMEGIPAPSHVPMLDVTPLPAAEIPPADAGAWADSDTAELDRILNSVFDRPASVVVEEVEPAPAPRRGRPRRA